MAARYSPVSALRAVVLVTALLSEFPQVASSPVTRHKRSDDGGPLGSVVESLSQQVASLNAQLTAVQAEVTELKAKAGELS